MTGSTMSLRLQISLETKDVLTLIMLTSKADEAENRNVSLLLI